ncbi:MAG TPA: hypothetical protein VF613_23155 [Longimicrobium sp.]
MNGGTAGESAPAGHGPADKRSAMGRYAHIAGTSDEFAEEKPGEIDREARKLEPGLRRLPDPGVAGE